MSKESNKDIFEPEIPIVPSGWEIMSFKKAVDVISDKGKRIKKKQYFAQYIPQAIKTLKFNLSSFPEDMFPNLKRTVDELDAGELDSVRKEVVFLEIIDVFLYAECIL